MSMIPNMQLLLNLIKEGPDSSLFADAFSEQSCSNQWTDTILKLILKPSVETLAAFRKSKVRSEHGF